jgi:regulatory protein
MPDNLTFDEARAKLERFCAYQERCHADVRRKISALGIRGNDAENLIVSLIESGFLNETRFAQAFARGRHRIRRWGRERIERELASRGVSAANIRIALSEIDDNDYDRAFMELSAALWARIAEADRLKKRRKFCDALLRKGYESERVYSRAKELETETRSR